MLVLVSFGSIVGVCHPCAAADSDYLPVLVVSHVPGQVDVVLDSDISAHVGAMSGDTTYQIGGNYKIYSSPARHTLVESGELHFPISELKFPLDVAMAGIRARQKISFPYRTRQKKVSFGVAILFEEEFSQSFTRNAGTMEDSDWTDVDYPHFKTIYSTSKAELDASVFDLHARFYPIERRGSFIGFRVGAGAGYLRQQFDYSISNTTQDEYPYNTGNKVYIPGKTLTYELTYEIPYVEVTAGMTLEKGRNFSGAVDVRLAVSSWVNASDRDDHLLRGKLSEGSCDGDAVIFGLEGRFILYRRFFATLGVTAISIETQGTQTQTFYDPSDPDYGMTIDIDQKILSEQVLANLGLGIIF